MVRRRGAAVVDLREMIVWSVALGMAGGIADRYVKDHEKQGG